MIKEGEKMIKPLLGVGAIAAILLVSGVPPVLLLVLACPVMMIFMMRGMNHGTMNHRMDYEKEK
jgi:hypothetical protein